MDEKVNRILDIVGLNKDHATRYPHEFSGDNVKELVLLER